MPWPVPREFRDEEAEGVLAGQRCPFNLDGVLKIPPQLSGCRDGHKPIPLPPSILHPSESLRVEQHPRAIEVAMSTSWLNGSVNVLHEVNVLAARL